ncbi:SDR family oxidoreductase [Clostridium sp. D43t1_170807_H7]|uniref:SDR family oxidoreductase n=1 Tax=Clostridium sp. D43t1_170807_H7 TaxID=2787140 RepID=UPI001898D566|nr:SDR family oxidoreductase [Clostridium sp. D43t1_170807_H7]
MGYENIKFPPNTRFLVTGGAGFIGSNLVEALLNKNCFVRVLDNFSTGKQKNIEPFLKNKNFQFIKGDIRDFNVCNTACYNIDYILHEAALGSVPKSIKFPQLYEDVNINGTLNIFVAARDNNVKKVVYASSSSVYGDNYSLPKKEDFIGMPLSPYALTKRVNELYSSLFSSIYNLQTIGLRYFNVFGKNQDPDSQYSAVIPKFIKSFLNGITPTINGDGHYSRDFTYVENIIEANLKACISDESLSGEVFNIGCGDTITLNKLYSILASSLNFNLPPIYGPTRPGDIPHSNADISKAKKLLGYSPSYSFEDGIKLTLNWYKKNLYI